MKFDNNQNKNMKAAMDKIKATDHVCKCEAKHDYGFYSKVLNRPFDTLSELKAEEDKYYAAMKAKEDKAAAKKNDAAKVEEAFKALNAARKTYKDDLVALTSDYAENLKKMKAEFESAKTSIHERLAAAEASYEKALHAFTEKYPEGYHLTLKDGDFETTIHSSKNAVTDSAKVFDIFDMLFRM